MLPDIALAIRQPWAWAVVAGVKDIENRTEYAVRSGGMKPRRIAVLASKGMTRDEYEDASFFMRERGVRCPAPAMLLRGGIIGSVDVVDIVKKHDSPWWMPPNRGLVLANAEPCDLIPAVGQLGYFQWRPADQSVVPPPARWMYPKPATQSPGEDLLTTLIDGGSSATDG